MLFLFLIYTHGSYYLYAIYYFCFTQRCLDDDDGNDDDASDDDDGDASSTDEMSTWHFYPLSLVTKRESSFGYESSHS